ncbi:Putative ubiquitin system component CUE, UBA-like superfamily [Colletotrichum destructivum]|uniref:Ubiquitin system component CUE, UBA-like superfamily n=1 Tax=Colletotrichum destructivum TaxID=34406 RepID=A0AAX4IDT1_9PEZI|nr:Putative ubiquitin system component CUE, UBA-like superfamily [Colletotrichum destructivum]
MSAPNETNKTSAPESPTTVRPLDLSDDDDVQETGVLSGEAPNQNSTTTTNTNTAASSNMASSTTAAEAAPPKPPRPSTETQKTEDILKEAFPSIDISVIKAVLRASGGKIDPAFNALLEMTDPDAAQNETSDEQPPPQPPRPQGGAQLSQLEADELYARQLAEHFDNVGSYEARTSNRSPGGRVRRQQTGLEPRPNAEDRESNFFEDELPVIQEKLRKGFIETQGKVNNWITTMKKRFDEEFADEDENSQRPGQAQAQGQYGARRPGESSRRSGDYERYDADPQVLSDDFAGMKFAADGTPLRDNNRPLSNPDLYKPPPPSKSPKPHDGRKVAFREGAEEIDVYGSSPRRSAEDVSGSKAKSSKWQPLSTVDPNPISDNDPFSLGDSEDEREAKEKATSSKDTKDANSEDSERLKKAAAEAMADSLVESKGSESAGAGAKKN